MDRQCRVFNHLMRRALGYAAAGAVVGGFTTATILKLMGG